MDQVKKISSWLLLSALSQLIFHLMYGDGTRYTYYGDDWNGTGYLSQSERHGHIFSSAPLTAERALEAYGHRIQISTPRLGELYSLLSYVAVHRSGYPGLFLFLNTAFLMLSAFCAIKVTGNGTFAEKLFLLSLFMALIFYVFPNPYELLFYLPVSFSYTFPISLVLCNLSFYIAHLLRPAKKSPGGDKKSFAAFFLVFSLAAGFSSEAGSTALAIFVVFLTLGVILRSSRGSGIHTMIRRFRDLPLWWRLGLGGLVFSSAVLVSLPGHQHRFGRRQLDLFSYPSLGKFFDIIGFFNDIYGQLVLITAGLFAVLGIAAFLGKRAEAPWFALSMKAAALYFAYSILFCTAYLASPIWEKSRMFLGAGVSAAVALVLLVAAMLDRFKPRRWVICAGVAALAFMNIDFAHHASVFFKHLQEKYGGYQAVLLDMELRGRQTPEVFNISEQRILSLSAFGIDTFSNIKVLVRQDGFMKLFGVDVRNWPKLTLKSQESECNLIVTSALAGWIHYTKIEQFERQCAEDRTEKAGLD